MREETDEDFFGGLIRSVAYTADDAENDGSKGEDDEEHMEEREVVPANDLEAAEEVGAVVAVPFLQVRGDAAGRGEGFGAAAEPGRKMERAM